METFFYQSTELHKKGDKIFKTRNGIKSVVTIEKVVFTNTCDGLNYYTISYL